jgi:hypothetical protein
VELNRDGLDQLRREILERSVPTQKAWWGYDVIRNQPLQPPSGGKIEVE